MKISASVVTYNNENEIRDVLNSIFHSNCINEMDVYVVDNCSMDNTVEIVRNEFPNAILINSEDNVGYGGGHNQALRITDSEYHLVINPDIKFEFNLIKDIIEYLDKNTDVVLCIPKVNDMDGILKYPPKRDPNLRYLFSRFFPQLSFMKKYQSEYCMVDETRSSVEPFDIEICSGSFMVMRRLVAQSVGFFDERYFMYFEDFDLSRSMRSKGKIKYLPQFQVMHEGKRAAHHSKIARKMLLSSMIKYFNKWGWKI